MTPACDILVVGAGPCGLTAALALSQAGFVTALADGAPAAPRPRRSKAAPPSDGRSIALLPASVDLLRRLGVWKTLASQATPVCALDIVSCDVTGRVLARTRFEAKDGPEDTLAHNISPAALTDALRRRAGKSQGLTLLNTYRLTAIEQRLDHIRAVFSDAPPCTARLIVAADGARSATRAAAGIATRSQGVEKAAIVCTVTGAPHHNICREFHLKNGPLTLTPLGDDGLALVWVERPQQARHLLEAGHDEFRNRLRAVIGSTFPDPVQTGPRHLYPIRPQQADTLVALRLVLVGEAAHVLPPTGAQGFNLSLADVRGLVDCLTQARSLGERDGGGVHALADYQRQRRADIHLRSLASRGLDRWASAASPLAAAGRAAVMGALERLPLKHHLVRWGLERR